MLHLSDAQRHEALGMLRANATVSAVARAFNVKRDTIQKLRIRFQASGSVSDTPRSGRPRVTTAVEDNRIRVTHLRDRFQTASKTAREWPGRRPISRFTVRRRLKAHGIVARQPARRTRLLQRHRQARLNWARLHRRWLNRQWNTVIFSDESRFLLDRHDGRQKVYRRRNERYLPQCVSAVADKRSVMVWGAITSTDKSDLVIIDGNLTAQRYINDILHPHLLPFLARHRNNLVFQQDNAPAHRAFATHTFLQQNNVRVMTPWPALSPDLNVIEHLWDKIDKDIRSLRPPPTTIPQLQQSLIDAWNNIPQQYIQRLVQSMRRRCTAVINAGGSYTRYSGNCLSRSCLS